MPREIYCVQGSCNKRARKERIRWINRTCLQTTVLEPPDLIPTPKIWTKRWTIETHMESEEERWNLQYWMGNLWESPSVHQQNQEVPLVPSRKVEDHHSRPKDHTKQEKRARLKVSPPEQVLRLSFSAINNLEPHASSKLIVSAGLSPFSHRFCTLFCFLFLFTIMINLMRVLP